VPPPCQDADALLTNEVTGANSGLGLEAARHLTRLNAQKVILAVRTTSKGESARADIEQSTGRKSVVEVWSLDLLSYDSVKAFANKAKELPRLDAIVENAGISTRKFKLAEGQERTIMTNVISTFLLALLLLPKLRESGRKFNITPRLTFVSSEVHHFTQREYPTRDASSNAPTPCIVPEKSSPSIFDRLKDEHTADMDNRYFVSKLLQLLYFRQLTETLAQSRDGPVTMNIMNPGLCSSNIMGNDDPVPFVVKLLQVLVARRTEVGGRTLVASACASPDTHGKYMSDGNIAP
jgi:retinol dehydrogenase 12